MPHTRRTVGSKKQKQGKVKDQLDKARPEAEGKVKDQLDKARPRSRSAATHDLLRRKPDILVCWPGAPTTAAALAEPGEPSLDAKDDNTSKA